MKILILLCLIFLLFAGGCRGPDSFTVTFGEQKLLPNDIAWRGALISLTWNLTEDKK